MASNVISIAAWKMRRSANDLRTLLRLQVDLQDEWDRLAYSHDAAAVSLFVADLYAHSMDSVADRISTLTAQDIYWGVTDER